MHLYKETKDPSETKDYAFDWGPKLAEGETISAIAVALVDAAGCGNPSNSEASGVTRVLLSSGSHGQRCVYTVRVTTSGGRTLEEAFGVDVVDTVLGAPVETEVDRLTRQIAEAKAQRHKVAKGEAVVEVGRDGRRMVRKFASMGELEAYIRALESELAAMQIEAGETPTRRRRAIGLAWRN